MLMYERRWSTAKKARKQSERVAPRRPEKAQQNNNNRKGMPVQEWKGGVARGTVQHKSCFKAGSWQNFPILNQIWPLNHNICLWYRWVPLWTGGLEVAFGDIDIAS